ncbi:MAG: hypothetical protein PVI22_18190, partial [Lysobacterales bacterium]
MAIRTGRNDFGIHGSTAQVFRTAVKRQMDQQPRGRLVGHYRQREDDGGQPEDQPQALRTIKHVNLPRAFCLKPYQIEHLPAQVRSTQGGPAHHGGSFPAGMNSSFMTAREAQPSACEIQRNQAL